MAEENGTAEARLQRNLRAIDAREDEVGAFAHLDLDGALAVARKLDAEGGGRPLDGHTVGVKDIFDTADMPTAYGSSIYEGHRPRSDAAIVALVRRAGGIVLGKTVTTEFAAMFAGRTRNPHNLDHTPGGSSSGSAAAVAAGMVDLALGTQTGGSVIRPAAFCGVVGYKPTFDAVSTAGMKPYAWSLDTVGMFARDVAGAARLGSVLTGRRFPAGAPAHPPRLGLYLPPEIEAAEEGTREALSRAAAMAREAGAEIVDIEPPRVAGKLEAAARVINDFEASRSLLFEFETHRDRLSDRLAGDLERGLAISASDYDSALATAAEGRAGMGVLFAAADAVLTPAAPGEAPEGLASTGDPVFNRVWTMLGMPAITLPGLTGGRGLPLGVQMVGPRHGDASLLSAAAWLEPVLKE